MLFNVTLKNFTGSVHIVKVSADIIICDFKSFLSQMYSATDILIFKNMKEIKSGTIESNNIKPDDTLNISWKLRAGFDICLSNEMIFLQENYKSYSHEYEELKNELEIKLNEFHSFNETKSKTPLEILSEIQQNRKISFDDFEKNDLRILFQHCRNQIEDEANNMTLVQKEHDRTKRNIDELRQKMSLRK